MINKLKIFWYKLIGFRVILKHESYKRCRVCSKYKPLTTKYYKKHGKSKFRHSCRVCEIEVKQLIKTFSTVPLIQAEQIKEFNK